MQENWKVVYFLSSSGDNPVSEFIDSLEFPQQVKVLRLFKLIKEYGMFAVKNHLKKLAGTPFWEMRILGKDNIRFVYLVVVKNTVLILTGFVKKGEKTPQGEINLAVNRYQDWLKRKKSTY